MNILITAPSLNVNKNVSGISSVVNTIIDNNKANQYFHFTAGNEDDASGFLNRILSLSKSYLLLVYILLKKDIPLIHLNLPLNPRAIYRESILLLIAKLLNKTILIHLHGGKYLLEKPSNILLRKLISQMFKSAEIIICLSTIEKTAIENLYGLKKVYVLQNTIDDSYLKLNGNKKQDDILNILFLGRLHESKGIAVIINSIKFLLEKGHKQIRFMFCGIGPMLEDILKLTQIYPTHVKYLGIVSGEAKKEILLKAQVFILPSLYGEGLPMSLLEAMAAGLVPIVTNDGSMQSVVSHRKNGFIIKKNDSRLLSNQIEMLLDDSHYRNSISVKAKTFAMTNFSINSYIYSLNDFYKLSIS